MEPNQGDQQSVATIEDVSFDDMSEPSKPAQGFDGKSALKHAYSGNHISDNSQFMSRGSMQEIYAMTATQRVFETITVDIETQSFHNVYQTLIDKRDMSQASLRELWRQKFLNEPLKDGQTVHARVNIMILDVLYIADENYEVFDSAK